MTAASVQLEDDKTTPVLLQKRQGNWILVSTQMKDPVTCWVPLQADGGVLLMSPVFSERAEPCPAMWFQSASCVALQKGTLGIMPAPAKECLCERTRVDNPNASSQQHSTRQRACLFVFR
jgi:hypothetical protein